MAEVSTDEGSDMSFVIIDLDNTLVDRISAFRRWAAQFLVARNLDLKYVDALEELDEDGIRQRRHHRPCQRGRCNSLP